MSTIMSFIQDEPKHHISNKISSKPPITNSQKQKEVEIKAPSIPSNRERIINVELSF